MTNLTRLPNEFRIQIEEILKDAEAYTQIFDEHREKLLRNHPGRDEYFYNYWAARLSFLYSDPTETEIEFSHPIDPTSITIKIQPDYGS